MQFFPLDAYTKEPVALMEVVPGDPAAPVIWDVYRDIIAAANRNDVILNLWNGSPFTSVPSGHML